MEPHYRLRIYILTALILFGFGTLLTRLHSFQIERRDEFQAQVPGSRIVTVREPGIRGEITDRNGIALARNLRNYEVSLNLAEIDRAYRLQHDEAPILDRLVTEDGMSRKRSERDIVAIVKELTINRLAAPNLNLARDFNAKALATHYRTHGGLVPFTYRADLNYEDFAKFAEHNLDLPGVYLNTRPQREYPYGSLASHVLGIVKQWEKGDIPEAAAREFDHYIGDQKGDGGIEESMDKILRGVEGKRWMLKNEKGVVTNDAIPPVPPGVGARVELAIDARIQFLVENTLRRIGRGAGVVMDVNTGEVLAMASVPDYDLNAFIPSIKQKRLDEYEANKLGPFTNRALSGFAPGSTFKIPTALAGAMEGMASRSFSCDGGVPYGNHRIKCWIAAKGGSHGSLTLPKAIQQSCNPYFNKLANTIGWRAMVDGFQMVGFGQKTGIELPSEEPGVLPGSRDWRARNPNGVMTPVETAFLSIGQGNAMATPLQLCSMVCAVANGGKYYQPRIVKKAVAGNGDIVIPDVPKMKVDITQAGVKPSDLELIRKGMWMAVNQPGGTAGRVKIPNIEVAAKTGTAQTIDAGKKSHNSWVMSFGPYENPKYAICVVVQNGGSGGAVCGPLVNLIYRGLFAQDEGLKLPLRPQTEFAGNTDRYEEVKLPEDVLAAIDVIPAEEGETGEESGDVTPQATPSTTKKVSPKPTITTEADEAGTVPRAKPVRRR